jgi:CubicO group peptidase (beta-lactamase class C family)
MGYQTVEHSRLWFPRDTSYRVQNIRRMGNNVEQKPFLGNNSTATKSLPTSRTSPDILARLHMRLAASCASGQIRAVSLAVRHGGALVDRWASGWVADPHVSNNVTVDTRFLVASLTKPITAAAVMRLVEEGEISLGTPVASILPQFKHDGRKGIQLWHLLTHTSGLPDMISDNVRLRERHAGLPEFFERLCREPLLFAPGTRIGYQSMGSLVIAMIIERLTNVPFPAFVSREILQPAGMTESELGLSPQGAEYGDAQVELPEGQRDTNWHWNSRYWRTLGAPWGGLTSTATDLAAFLHIFLSEGCGVSGRRVLAPVTVAVMCRDWASALGADFPAFGLGWMLRGQAQPAMCCILQQQDMAPSDPTRVVTSPDIVYDRAFFADLMSEQAFGHTGVTGCAMWADPALSVAAVVLTSTPSALSNGTISLAANMIASSVEV